MKLFPTENAKVGAAAIGFMAGIAFYVFANVHNMLLSLRTV